MRPMPLLCKVVVIALAMLPSQGQAQQPVGSPPSESSLEDIVAPVPTAPVTVDGVALFSVRGVSSYTAEIRAAEIGKRIKAFARDRNVAADAVTLERRELGMAVLAGDQVLMYVVEPDARLEGVDVNILAAAFANAIKTSATRYRSEREPGFLARAIAYATGALLVAVLLLFLLYRLYRMLNLRLTRFYRIRLDDLEIEGFKVLQAEQMWSALRGGLKVLHVLLALTVVYLALNFSLHQFPVTRGTASQLLDVVVSPLLTIGSGLLAIIPDLVFLIILAVLTRFVLKTLRLFFGAIEQGAVRISGFDAEWGTPTYRIVRIMVVAFALVVAYPYIPGSQSDAFKGISLFIGVIFSIGSSSFVSNIIAGYVMTYRRAFSVGDRIRVGEVFGDVTAIRMQVTHVRSPKNEEIIVPNSSILTNNVINYSKLAKSEGLVLHTTVGIGYETPWRQVEAMLLMAAERTGSVKQDPPPFVLQTLLGDFAISYELNCHCDQPAQMARIYTELHRNILDVFNEYGVAIMTPAYEGDTAQPKLVPREQWYAAPAREE